MFLHPKILGLADRRLDGLHHLHGPDLRARVTARGLCPDIRSRLLTGLRLNCTACGKLVLRLFEQRSKKLKGSALVSIAYLECHRRAEYLAVLFGGCTQQPWPGCRPASTPRRCWFHCRWASTRWACRVPARVWLSQGTAHTILRRSCLVSSPPHRHSKRGRWSRRYLR